MKFHSTTKQWLAIIAIGVFMLMLGNLMWGIRKTKLEKKEKSPIVIPPEAVYDIEIERELKKIEDSVQTPNNLDDALDELRK